MQVAFNEVHQFASLKSQKIKESKTQLVKFNFAKHLDFPVEFDVPGFENLVSVTDEVKILGVLISSSLKWDSNTAFLCKKAYTRLWTLRRLKSLGVEPLFILDVYIKEIRSVLELAVPVWHSGLTIKLAADIERVQRVAVTIILGERLPYYLSLAILNIEPLSDRREKLCKKFASKTLKSRHSDIFVSNIASYQTRHKQKFRTSHCNTKRFFNSPVNFLTRMLNDM